MLAQEPQGLEGSPPLSKLISEFWWESKGVEGGEEVLVTGVSVYETERGM